MKTWDTFISHASPEKERFVLPLANALQEKGVSVWLDRWEIKLGSSISESISEGLKLSRFGIVVLSKSFFARSWPKRELGALFAKENEDASHIIPIWFDVDYDYVWENAPLLADRMAARADEGIGSIADRISRLIERVSSQSRGVTQEKLRHLTLELRPDLPADPFWEAQILGDIDSILYRDITAIEISYRRALPAITAYATEQPSLFRSGTDYITKALGFTDLCFRSRHQWAPETMKAFQRYASKVRWDIDG